MEHAFAQGSNQKYAQIADLGQMIRDKARKSGQDTNGQKPTFLSFLLLSWAEM